MSEEIKQNLQDMIGYRNDAYYDSDPIKKGLELIKNLEAENKELREAQEWISRDQFESNYTVCWCWVLYRDSVQLASYHTGTYFKKGGEDKLNKYLITDIKPLNVPKPPKEQE